MRPCWSFLRSWIVRPVTWAKAAPVKNVQSAAVAKKRRAVIVVSPRLLLDWPAPALPGLCVKKPDPLRRCFAQPFAKVTVVIRCAGKDGHPSRAPGASRRHILDMATGCKANCRNTRCCTPPGSATASEDLEDIRGVRVTGSKASRITYTLDSS